MELAQADRSIVVVIDLQGKLVDMVHRPGLVIAATRRLLRARRAVRGAGGADRAVSRRPGADPPGDPRGVRRASTVPKRRLDEDRASAVAATPRFEETLGELRPGLAPAERQLVVAGIEAHVCVMQTVLEALRAGNAVHLCWECVSGRGAEYRRWALERMQQAGAVITNHESVGLRVGPRQGPPAVQGDERDPQAGSAGPTGPGPASSATSRRDPRAMQEPMPTSSACRTPRLTARHVPDTMHRLANRTAVPTSGHRPYRRHRGQEPFRHAAAGGGADRGR